MIDRTPVDFPTYGPEGDEGESWHEYFVRLTAEEEPEPVSVTEVLVEGREASPEEISSCLPLGRYLKLLHSNGWTALAGYSRSFTAGIPIKTGEKQGELHNDVTLEQLWINAHKAPQGIVAISYARRNGGKWVCSFRNRNRLLEGMSDVEMKEWIKSDVPTG